MLDNNTVSLLKEKKNLLAFSGGVDSSALFFILHSFDIDFDLIMVDYGLREQSKEEVLYAKSLCNKYNKKLFLKKYQSDSNFNEKIGRDFRHSFFKQIAKTENYNSIITGHQLNDKFEWLLLQLSKGAGVRECFSMDKITHSDDISYFKPLLDISREEIEDYLDKNDLEYYIDSSNLEDIYKRNKIRNNFSNNFIKENLNGIKKSFQFIEEDLKELTFDFTEKRFEETVFFSFDNLSIKNIIFLIDKELKKRGIIISGNTRKEIESKNESVVSHKYCVYWDNNKILISPFVSLKLNKDMKEFFRINKIPKLHRPYLSQFDLSKLKSFFI